MGRDESMGMVAERNLLFYLEKKESNIVEYEAIGARRGKHTVEDDDGGNQICRPPEQPGSKQPVPKTELQSKATPSYRARCGPVALGTVQI
jgi:hypothetical protein